MKKFLIVWGVVCILYGCQNNVSNKTINKQGYNTYDRQGISFQYPSTMTISEDPKSMDSSNINYQTNITVSKRPISEIIKGCLTGDKTLENRDEAISKDYLEALRSLKEMGINEKIYKVDTLGCGLTTGNIQTTSIKVGDLNGVIFAKCECQDSGELESFRMQLLVPDWYDQVYTIDFDFNFGKLKNYLKKIRDKNERDNGYPSTLVGEGNIDLWNQVNDFLSKNKPIEFSEIKSYEENSKVIKNIINSVQIKK